MLCFCRVYMYSFGWIHRKRIVATNLSEMYWARGRNEIRWRPGKETSLAPPCSNLRSFGSKCTALKKVLVTSLGLFGALRSNSAPGELCPPFLPRYAPDWDKSIQGKGENRHLRSIFYYIKRSIQHNAIFLFKVLQLVAYSCGVLRSKIIGALRVNI